jgi:hypothetical protein
MTLGASGAAADGGAAVAVAGAAGGGADGGSLAAGWGVGLEAVVGFTLEGGGVTAADGAGAAGAAAVAGGAGAGVMALTAVLQDPDRLARLRLRHSSASLPPGVTPEQFAMKSERQEARIAAI